MKVQIKIISSDITETINVDDIKDINHFEYIDTYGANNKIDIFDNGIEIIRVSDSHNTSLVLKDNEKSFVTIKSSEGIINFDAKILAFEKKDDIISLVYNINSDEKKIIIKYLGVSL